MIGASGVEKLVIVCFTSLSVKIAKFSFFKSGYDLPAFLVIDHRIDVNDLS